MAASVKKLKLNTPTQSKLSSFFKSNTKPLPLLTKRDGELVEGIEDASPTLSEEDLQFLVDKIKSFTTLFDLLNEDWTDVVHGTIRLFFESSDEDILCIFFDKNNLLATLGYPTTAVEDMTYFIKNLEDETMVTPENFEDTIEFGTVNGSIEGTLLNTIEHVYAPVFFNTTTWPDSIKSDFCYELNNFLCSLTDMYHKMFGLTVIYIPMEGMGQTVAVASENKDMVRRLEAIVGQWLGQMRVALNDQEEESLTEMLCPVDEYEFWIYRYDNLRGLRHQFENKQLKHISDILHAAGSTYITQFEALVREIMDDMVLTTSNIQFLQLLREPCMAFSNEVSPEFFAQYIPDILHALRIIWEDSPYYHSRDRLTALCHALSNQIIVQCTKYINMDAILFKGSSRLGKISFQASIDCCMVYKALYDKITHAHALSSQGNWDVDQVMVFSHVDSFIQRCQNMLEVCECMTHFGRMDETENIPKPQFGGTQGPEFEHICERVEKTFRKDLQRIGEVKHIILNVRAITWHDEMKRFRCQMRDLEVIIENLVEAVFATVATLADGIDTLQALYYYAKHQPLAELMESKKVFVFNLLLEEMHLTKTELVEDKDYYPSSMPRYAGCALVARMKKERISKLIAQLNDAEFINNYDLSAEVNEHYEKLCLAIEEVVKDNFRKWMDSLGDDILQTKLNRTLLCRSTSRPGLLEANFDRHLFNIVNEARYWEILKFDIPFAVMRVYRNWKAISLLYESVITVAMDYNRIIAALSDDERLLFKHLIKACDKKIEPGIFALQWSTEVSDVYISECCKHTEELQEFVDEFKEANGTIVKICERICDTSMINIPPTEGYQLDELEYIMSKYRHEVVLELINHYQNINKCLATVYDGFEDQIQQMAKHWRRYILKMDYLLEEAIRLCVKGSLAVMYIVLHGDGSSGSSPLLKLSADLEDSRIGFDPTLQDVGGMIMSIKSNLVSSIKIFPRLFEKFHLKVKDRSPYYEVVEEDSGCQKLQGQLNTEMTLAVSQMQTFLKRWDPFRDMWEVNKDLFLMRYENLKPKADAFNSDIGRYTEVANSVQMQESLSKVHFIMVSSVPLKKSIIRHCTIWQDRLTSLLARLIESRVEEQYHYTEVSSELVMHEPENLVEMAEAMNLFKHLQSEVPPREEELPIALDQYEVLERYEITLSKEFVAKMNGMQENWAQYLLLLVEAEDMLARNKEKFRTGLIEAAEIFKQEAADLYKKLQVNGPFTSAWKATDALDYLQVIRSQLDELRKREQQLREDLAIFNISFPASQELHKLERDLEALEVVWELTHEWNQAWESYKSDGFWTIETEDMEVKAQTLFRKLTRLSRELKDRNWQIVDHSRLRVDAFRRTLPLLGDLKNPAMRDRHWERVKRAMHTDFDQHSPEFTLDAIMEMKMQDYADDINEISNAATMELAIEMGLKAIAETWKHINVDMIPHKDRPVYRLKAVDDIFQLLEENQMALASMKSTRFVEPFAKEVDYWERTLSVIMEVLELFLNVQRQWLYLENIFGGEDIRKQLPGETDVFDSITREWSDITNKMFAAKNALKATHLPNMWKTLNRMNEKLEAIQRALEKYLETKRHIFPRFYFISNDDLLEILAQSKKPDLVQPHLKKCFDNINKLRLNKPGGNRIQGAGMFSADGELVDFKQEVEMEGPVELWLCKVEYVMRITLRDQLKQCRLALKKHLTKRDKWIKEWPGQMCITASQIQWTTDCTRTLLHCKALEAKTPLRKLRKKMNQVLNKFSDSIRGQLSKIQRLKVVALVTIEIHARDVIDKMYKAGCMDSSTFEWLSQLRFYWDREIDNCIARQTNTCFNYGYEYLGNSGRLVITPLTDRCYITLTTALHLHRGGSPKGPAGTGKTETVKDLGKGLGMYVIVVNCSEGLDYKSMGRMFSGLAQTGAWGCFDEFNRINIEVLSVVAQQILSILSALAAKLRKFIFESTEINLVETCGIFITMNPGYAGRTELPDNLKSMFRPISMIVPDSAMISEIILFGEGFKNTRMLAKKVYTLYQLAMQQLSKQDHYDFGLRGMVALLRYAGRKRRMHSNLPNEEVILLAMKDMNVAKLTADDLPLFNGITSDLFPGIDLPTIEYEELSAAIDAEFREHGLQSMPSAIIKVIQLHETKNSRHSVMIVGKTGSGKTATWRTLQNSLSRLRKENIPGYNLVKDFPINPKALNLGELYGEFNLSTNEWLDGVLSAIMRKTCADELPDEKWIVFDGPVDAVWIENMNSVMDDNKVLTLINSERIVMPEQVSLLFEVADLAVASPATVSRCGMVYNDYKDLGWRPYVNSWYEKQKSKEFANEIKPLFNRFVNAVLEFKRHNCVETVTLSELNSVVSLCKLLECLATKANGIDESLDKEVYQTMIKLWFLFCLVWSICAGVDEAGRRRLDLYLRELEGCFPLKDTVYEYYVDVRSRAMMLWEGKLSDRWRMTKGAPFFKIIVPTVDTVRYQFLVSTLLDHGYPGLLVGPVGTGKTSTAVKVLESLDPLKYCVLMVNMSAQTTSNNVQDMIESRVEKRTKGVYVPAGNKTMITFMDDLNMPAKETYGSQPPLELIRQWIDYGFWYDRQKQERKYVKEMMLMAAMGPPGGGRNVITERLLSRFNVINMTFPSIPQIERIFGTMLDQQLMEFPEEIKALAEYITKASIDLYMNVIAKMLPTPTKTHYLFNLRDISKIFQGLLRSHKDYQNTKPTILRLWVHECFRVFNDRLIDEKDQEWFVLQMNEQLGRHFDLTFHNLCHEKDSPIFGHFVNAWNIYEDLQDLTALRKYIELQLEEYNVSPGVIRMSLVLFKDAISHICRIVRIVSQPRGNVLLVGIGGSGRQSLARIASYMCEYGIFQIEVTKNYRVQEFREDLKILYKNTGVEGKEMAFLFNDTQIADECFLEIINNVLSSGEVPNLYKTEEFEEIKNLLQKAADKEKIQSTTEAMFNFMIERVRANMHIILCMSPIGDSFRNRLRQYPSLVNCTTIDWFHEWPKEALLEVANKYLDGVNFLETITGDSKMRDFVAGQEQERLREAVAGIFATIHDSVSKCSKRMMTEMKRPNYVTPTNYLELVAGYKAMLEEKRKLTAAAANKLRNGLYKIDDTRDKVAIMAIELEVAKVQVAEYQQQCDEYLVIIMKQQQEADEQQKSVAARSVKIQEEEVGCKKLAAAAQADLDEAMPALEEAMRALDALNKKDLTEIRSYGRPPAKVQMVMEAVMILKKMEPTWAESKRQLGEQNFLKDLREFDKDNISDRTLKKIAVYTKNEDFEPDKVGIVSFAAKSLCLWVIAIEKYGKLYRIVAPKRQKLEEAMAVLHLKQKSLAEAQAKLVELALMLEKLQKEYEEKLEQKEELRKKAEILEQKLERAAQLVDGLAGEKIRWEQTVANLDLAFTFLPGDCLIATGFVSYLGPFVTIYRDDLVDLWKKTITEEEVPLTTGLSLSTFQSDPTTIREWNIQGLPSDDFSTENGIIVTKAMRWPLLIDPQCQGMKWIKNMEAAKNLKMIDFGQPDFMRTLESAIQFGHSVLLQNVMEVLDPSLGPILDKAFIKQGGMILLKINDKMVSYNEAFRFFITTKLSNPHYAPEISTKTTLVNFAVKEQGLQAQLLGIVVRKERPILEEQKDSLVMNIATGKRTLIDLEDELLRLLNETKGSLLDDLELLITLQTSKATSTSVTEQLLIAETTEVEIDTAREGYRSSALRASILFFVLNDMSRIDPMYQFSLDSYIDLFIISIAKSKKSDKLEDRIFNLNEYHTYAVYRNTCRGLFEQHKLLFSFHMCIKILEAQNKISIAEYNFLLKGGVVLDRQEQLDNPCPGWMTDINWDNITELDKLSGFHGVVNTFETYPRDWNQWYTHNQPETQPLIGEWDGICTEFQRMLFVRSLRPDRITSCVTSFIINTLGNNFVEPPVLDIKVVLEDSTNHTPLIFVLSAGVDPTNSLIQLAETSGMGENFYSLSLGQGQAPIATKLIQQGARDGNWVFLANCHLSLSWMPKLDKIVDTLQTGKVNPKFRLWLSSSPHPDFPISILQAGIKMTTEPPKGLKANLKRLYQLVTEQQFTACENHTKYRRLLFSLCFFHGVLLERKKFQKLGWNVDYSFNDSDFVVSECLLSIYLDEYVETPWDALKYLIAGVNYGGHVTDDWDRRLLTTYINQYFIDGVLSTHNYRLSKLPTYHTPRDGSLLSYYDYISTLPNVDQPEVFGQHSNADITSLITETRSLFETLMSLQVQVTQSKGESKEDKVSQLAADVLSKTPQPIDYENTDKLIGAHKTPLDVVLLQEIARYNKLLVIIRSSLEDLQRGIQGFVVMSSYLEDIFICIFEGRVPQGWLRAYPSLKLLGSWARDLVQRVEHFSTWAETTHPPIFFWLSAYTFPTGFLTAILQTSARSANISIDSLSWEFTVFTHDERSHIAAPKDGVFIRGLYLEGAGWDKKNNVLMEPLPMQLVCPMPLIHFKPVEQAKKKMRGMYNCPSYYYPLRCGDTGRPAFVVAVDLKSGAENADHWIKRATALLLSLAN